LKPVCEEVVEFWDAVATCELIVEDMMGAGEVRGG